jgi:hypothetical protein
MANHSRRFAALLLGTLLVSAAAVASAEPDDDGWTPFAAPPSTGSVQSPTTAEGGFGSPDRTRLDQALRHGVLDQVCRQAQIPLNYNYGVGDYGGVGTGIDRYLRTDVDDQIALVDDENLKVDLTHGWSKAIGAGGEAIGLNFGARIEGHSMVIRRTGSKSSCAEVLSLLDFRKVKTVLPMKGERLSRMALGELWRIPFTLTYAEGVSVGESAPVGAGTGGVSVSFGRGDSGAASMTLYRIADDKLRFRFRIDHVVVYSQSLGVTEVYPPIAFAIGAQNILTRFVEREFARQLQQYTLAWMSFGRSSSDGKKFLMEFVIDPRDPAQADALAKVVRGDMRELVKLSAKMSTFQTNQTMADYLKLMGTDADKLGPSTYAASDEYKAKLRSFTLNLPFFVSHNSSSLFGEDKVDRYTGEEGEFHFFKADKSKNNSYFSIPWVGPWVKNNTQRDVEAVTYAPKGGPAGDPIVVYIRNRGYRHVTGSTVRDDVSEINSVMRLAGAARGKDGGPTLPLDALVPPSPKIESRAPRDGGVRESEPSDRNGLMSFTLVMNERAVKDVLAASSQAVLKAFAASVGADDRGMAEWLAAHATVGKNGDLQYDRREARRAFPDAGESMGRGNMRDDNMRDLSSLSEKAAGLIADIAAGRDAKNNEERAQALAVMIGGKGKSGLAYEDVLRVVVQFVDPLDLTGDFVANVKTTTKGVKSPNQHFVLKKGRAEVPLLQQAGDAKARFAEPSILTD